MYHDRLGTDWESLGREQIIVRAFALGVATACGNPNEEEYDRLIAELESAYDRSIVELAYEEGRTKARELRRTAESDDEVWEALVDENATSQTITRGAAPATKARPALTRFGLLDRPRDSIDAIRLPSFLSRSGQSDDEEEE